MRSQVVNTVESRKAIAEDIVRQFERFHRNESDSEQEAALIEWGLLQAILNSMFSLTGLNSIAALDAAIALVDEAK
ncbi:hypothetical protein UFOVP1305_4 [uncultured Caudovirales phage]|uniref:Uncharacterized protein n=1 Tax=uncultured Caudovirales phage TaxID=2100421 RepID=A0A6J5RSN8_9CAUD|nr:hypothetical protein UFOVP896_42 [uncultured Caudovirales phage]CAB4197277.1 hypothetical protein UFOVP1305_4 [uncultured Caudovirales phage]